MMKIVKQDLKRLLRNPFYYIGFLLIAINVWASCESYLNIHYFDSDYKPVQLSDEEKVDLDIDKGYIPPANMKERITIGLTEFRNRMLRDKVLSNEEIDTIIDEILDKNMSIEEAINYINKDGKIHISGDIFSEKESLKEGTATELNNYIDEKLNNNTYTSYFAKKYVDYFGIHLVILNSLLLVFLTMYDFSNNTYELLHTKPLSSSKFIISKVISGSLSILIFVVVITFFFDCVVTIYGLKHGLAVNFFDIWKYVLLCTIPSVIFSVCFCVFITTIFKKSIVAIPMMMLLILYANQGIMVSGEYTYKHRLFQIISRFPELFFETSINSTLIANQLLLIILSIIMVVLSCKIWERNQSRCRQ